MLSFFVWFCCCCFCLFTLLYFFLFQPWPLSSGLVSTVTDEAASLSVPLPLFLQNHFRIFPPELAPPATTSVGAAAATPSPPAANAQIAFLADPHIKPSAALALLLALPGCNPAASTRHYELLWTIKYFAAYPSLPNRTLALRIRLAAICASGELRQ